MTKLMKYAKEYLWQSIVCPFLMVGEVLLELLIPYNAAYIINYANSAINGEIANPDITYIIKIGVKMLLMAIGSLLCGAFAARLAAVASMGFGSKLRDVMYDSVQRFSFANIDKFSTASLVTRMTTDVTMIQNMYQMMLRIMFRAPLQFVCALIMSFRISTDASKVFLIVIPIIVVVMLIFGPIAMKLFKKMFDMMDALNASVQENLISIRVVKAFVRGDYEKEKFKKSNDNLMAASIAAERLMVLAQPLMMILMFATILAVAYICSGKIIIGDLTIGDFSTLITYIMQILMSVIMIAVVLVQFIMSQASAKRIREVIEEQPDINDDSADKSLKVADGSVEFRNVSFKYNKDAKKNVIDNANLKINSGEVIGIIGATGSAKTTLVSLIPRLYDVSEGEVLVSGHNVKDYSIAELREAVSMVLQKNVLFSGTIESNLRWGDKNATDEELVNACKAAQAHDFVMSFPDGYKTDLGQGGVNVSGGQKQRLCIARAMLKKPKILILDDSTSAVDTFTDSKIRDAFKTAIPNTTKLIIAQRISSVENADKIVVLDDGKINDVGTHSELMERNEIYRDVYMSQQKGIAEQGGAL